jgi:subtilisin family serine protease
VRDELGLYGQGQIVAIADTGLDTGDAGTLSADFAGRLVEAFALGRPGDWSDPQGHGTHVAGSVLGSGALSGSDAASHAYTGSFAGMAPEARFVFQSMLDAEGGLGGIPDDLQTLFQQAYDAGARVHTNSWGANLFIKPLARFLTSGRYTPEAAQVDRYVWEHPDLVVLFAAGNDGVDLFSPSDGGFEMPVPDGVVDPSSLASPGTAKNVITVGASENIRSQGGHAQETWGTEGDLLSAFLGSGYAAEPLASDLPSDHAEGMAAFSGRGPAHDGRIKPDVVAPGTNVLSARSHAPGAGELFGSHDDNYVYCSGTSMATPLTAGVVALIRQWYVEHQGVSSPSAALIKATLINGTVDIRPGQYGAGPTQDVPDVWPNPVTGWGRVNARYSLPQRGSHEVWFVDAQEGLSAGEEAVHERYVAAGSEPLRVTLVWTDPPGEIEPESITIPGLTEPAAPVLVNDLDLVVESPDSVQVLGNMGAEPDRLNNVEAARIAAPIEGEYRFIVRGHNVGENRQPYALVVAGQRVVSGRPTQATQPGEGVVEPPDEGDGGGTDWIVVTAAVLGGLVILAAAGLLLLLRARGRSARPPAARPTRRGSMQGQSSLPPTFLRGEAGPRSGQRLAVGRPSFVLGRGPENDLVIDSAPISRQHARLEFRGDRWHLYDLDSANGTFLNHQRLTSPQPLHDGDLVSVGDAAFLFQTEPIPRALDQPPAQPPRSRRLLAIGAAVVTLALVVVAAALLVSGLSERDAEGTPQPGLPTVGLPDIDLPTGLPSVELPTGIPSIEIPTGMPTGIPTGLPTGLPTGVPAPTGGLPIPTGELPPGLPVPTLEMP